MTLSSVNTVWKNKDFNSNATILEILNKVSKKNSSDSLIEFNDLFLEANIFWKVVKQKSLSLQNIFKKKLKREIFPGECIGLASGISLETLSDLLAILYAGGAFVPYDLQCPKERIDYMLNNACVKVMLNQGRAYFAENSSESHLLFEVNEKSYYKSETNLENMSLKVNCDQLAYIMYTSGTSGRPKGVKISHRALWHYCAWFRSLDIIKECDRFDFSTNLTFDASITTTLVALTYGKPISVCSEDTKGSPRAFLQYLIQKQISFCKCTPSYFKLLVNESQFSLIKIPQIVNWLFTGEEMSALDSATWLELHPHHVFYNSYGPTEATVTCSKFRIDRYNIDQYKNKIPIEKNSRACEFYIIDSNMNPVPHGVKGELCIEGAILADGYLMNSEETNKNFIVGKNNIHCYLTGDEVISEPDGTIYYFGRIDSQVKIRGIRVELEEIRKVICSLDNILDTRVIVHVRQNIQQIFAFLVVNQSVKIESVFYNKVKLELLNKIPDSFIPNHFVILDKIPLTLSGKTDFQELHLFADNYSIQVNEKSATNPLEMSLLEIWREFLPQNKMGIDTSFFDIGGHSLLAMTVTDRINSYLNSYLPPNILFQKPTIRELGLAICNSQAHYNLHHLCHNENAPKLFLIHPASGMAHLYQELTTSLNELDFYALSNDRFADTENPYLSIEEMAASYINIIRKHCPNGPFILGGFCMGGVVAFEMLKQLKSLDIENCSLILIDSFKLKSLGTSQEKDFYKKTQLWIRGLSENTELGQKIIREIEHNQNLVVNYVQNDFTNPCLFIECKNLHSEVMHKSSSQELKNNNYGWFLPPDKSFLVTKKVIDTFHHTLFSDKISIEKMGKYILHFCFSFLKN